MSISPGTAHVLLTAHLMPSVVEALGQAVTLLDGRDPAERDRLVAAHAGSIRAIATNAHDGATRGLMEALPNLGLIACFSAGVDGIDLVAAAEHKVAVTSTSAALADDVADLAIAKCLILLRDLHAADRHVRSGAWRSGPMPLARTVPGTRLGLIGMGAIATAIAQRAAVMGMRIAYHTRRPKPAQPYRHVPTLPDLARDSDILVVCCPAIPETFHMVDAGIVAALGPRGYLVNIARGSVVDEAALVAALQSGTLAGAGLDVFEDEPNPLPALLAMDCVTLSPHIGSGTVETRAAMGRMMIDSLVAHLAAA